MMMMIVIGCQLSWTGTVEGISQSYLGPVPDNDDEDGDDDFGRMSVVLGWDCGGYLLPETIPR